MMGPTASLGETKSRELQKKPKTFFFFYLISAQHQGEEGREVSERESADGPHWLTGWTNVDGFSPGSDIYS